MTNSTQFSMSRSEATEALAAILDLTHATPRNTISWDTAVLAKRLHEYLLTQGEIPYLLDQLYRRAFK